MKQMITNWDAEKGIAQVTVFDNHDIGYTGYAYCAEEDKDFQNKMTGLQIAECRANLKRIRQEIQYAQERLKSLKDVYYSVIDSKGYDKTNVVAKRLYKHMKINQEEMLLWKSIYKSQLKHLNGVIEEKDKLYKQLRENRKKENK